MQNRFDGQQRHSPRNLPSSWILALERCLDGDLNTRRQYWFPNVVTPPQKSVCLFHPAFRCKSVACRLYASFCDFPIQQRFSKCTETLPANAITKIASPAPLSTNTLSRVQRFSRSLKIRFEHVTGFGFTCICACWQIRPSKGNVRAFS